MAPPKLYESRKELHVNVEARLKYVGDFFGLKPAYVLREGYKFAISQYIEEYGAPTEIKEQFSEILAADLDELNARIRYEKDIEDKAKKTGKQNRISAEIKIQEEQEFLTFIITELLPVFTPGEISWASSLARSSQAHVVRQVLPSIRSNYQTRTGKNLSPWSEEEETAILNHLIDLGGT